MAAPATTDDFLTLVRKSKLLSAIELRGYLSTRFASDPLPSEPKRAARRFVKDGLLTRFQAEQLLGGKYKPFTISGKYRLLERLGIGGMGFVYLCEHVSLRFHGVAVTTVVLLFRPRKARSRVTIRMANPDPCA